MSVKSPITLHLLNNGSTLKEYGRERGLNYELLVQTVNGHRKDRKCIEQLTKDGLWHLMERGGNHDQRDSVPMQGS